MAMANGQSKPSRHQKKVVRVGTMIDHLSEGMMQVPLARILWWREWVRSFARAVGEPDPLLNKRDDDVNKDLRDHKREITRQLKDLDWDVFAIGDPGDLIMIVENEKAGEKRFIPRLKHGQVPVLDAEHNDDYYKAYLTSVNRKMMGLAVFPSGSSPHPIAYLNNKRKTEHSTTSIKNSVKSVDYSEKIGTVSSDQNREIKGPAERKCLDAFHPYPLFEGQPALLPAPPPPVGPDNILDDIPDDIPDA